MSGWFAVKHGIRKHPIFAKRPDRLGAWIAMLDEAAYADTKQDVAGAVVDVKRGELCASQAMPEEVTGLSRQQLRTFLVVLEKAGAIKTRPATKSTKSRTIVTFCNYDKYQTPQPKANQEPTKGQPIKEQDNNIPPTEGAEKAPSIASIVFGRGRELLVAGGVPDAQARSMLGKWRKDHGDEALIAALGRLEREGAIDPISFVQGCFKWRAKKAEPEIGDIRVHPATGMTQEWIGGYEGWLNVHQ